MNLRMCVGCRGRADATELIRCVVDADHPGTLRIDRRRRIAGRGAHLHPSEACLEAAKRRRAFTRALRVSGPLDIAELEQYVTDAGQLNVHNP
ncbi:YlxR family protein [Cumulibacter soli]|uniref:YlxR family protein n=1 Tax=Cumulibacter soli TaxID=2546344 RepID=UPI001067B8D7|nr:YlxR family protein [Cumulibacter soli]